MPTYCPHCGFEAKQNKDHMALPPIMRHITYVQKVNQVFADVLMNVQDDEKKKLVLFSDSRSQAAKLSCGIELDHYHDMLRIAIYKALNNDVKSKLKAFYDFLYAFPVIIGERFKAVNLRLCKFRTHQH